MKILFITLLIAIGVVLTIVADIFLKRSGGSRARRRDGKSVFRRALHRLSVCRFTSRPWGVSIVV